MIFNKQLLTQKFCFLIALVTFSRFFQRFGRTIAVILNVNDDILELLFVILSVGVLSSYFYGFNGIWKFTHIKASLFFIGLYIPVFVYRIHSISNFSVLSLTAVIDIVCHALIEEIQFRGLLCSWEMKNANDKPAIIGLVVRCGIIFGLFHFFNILAGQGITTTVCQILFATHSGILYSLIFICCGSIWPSAVLHIIHNLICYVKNQGIILDNSASISMWINVVLPIVLIIHLIVWTYLVLNRRRTKTILNFWTAKWCLAQDIPS